MHFILTFFSHCHISLEQHGGIILSLLIAGLVGSFTHCSAMCGPFVMGQVMDRSSKIPVESMSQLVRLKEAALLPYHLGRISTYVFLAVMLTLFSNYILAITSFKLLTAFLLILAAFLLVSSSFPIFKYIPFPKIRGFKLLSFKAILAPLFANPRGVRGYVLGVFLGFLPCSLTIAALLMASSTGDVFSTMIAMCVFGVATVPALFLVGLGSNYMTTKYRREKIRKVAKVVMIFNGVSLLLLAGKTIME